MILSAYNNTDQNETDAPKFSEYLNNCFYKKFDDFDSLISGIPTKMIRSLNEFLRKYKMFLESTLI